MSTPNEILGGKPKITYFDIPSIGRGEVIRLFFKAAGVEYQDHRIPVSDWAATKPMLTETMNPTGHIPVVSLNGIHYWAHIPMLRYFAKKLGQFNGNSDEEDFFIDQILDICNDWRFSWAACLSGEKKLEAHQAYLKKVIGVFDKLAQVGLLGEQITIAELYVYQVLHEDLLLIDNKAPLKGYHGLLQLTQLVESHPRIAEYIKVRPTRK
ncbi:hypothetical protein HK103_004968 [Boothiomyces macroporosus]|uniref:Glutathione S-transferase n=1 Tax=Boothiomyces macroporosus TaxID=261099 RepID=A0AAD5Y7S2_9FUNG|nr:hypothetical protein HK103_004968 [Boothiomyces macroporosus]